MIELYLPMNRRDLKLKDVKTNKKKIQSVIARKVKEAIRHLNDEEGGWALRKDYIESEILHAILGFNIEDEINQEFINQGASVVYKPDGAFVEHKDGYYPIYMDLVNGNLIVANGWDKSHIKKYSDANAYFYVGKL